MLAMRFKSRSGPASVGLAIRRRLLRYILRRRDGTLLPPHVILPHDVVSSEMLVLGMHEADVLRSIFAGFLQPMGERFRGSWALDVGANIGNHSLYLAGCFEGVLAVEPNPDALHVLKANVALSGRRVEVVEAGLSDEECVLRFVRDTTGNLGASRFVGEDASPGTAAMIHCPVQRGDDVLAAAGLTDQISFVKIDAEGYELKVLRGLGETLRRNGPVVAFECLNSDANGEAVFEQLRAFGYERFFAVETSGNRVHNRFVGWFWRLLRGDDVSFSVLSAPARRDYELIIALTPRDAERIVTSQHA